MILNVKRKTLIGIVGLGKSGTTLLCNIINSADNAFCLCEPHWSLMLSPLSLRLDKVSSKLNIKTEKDVMLEVKKLLYKDETFDVAGIKETWAIERKKPFEYMTKGNPDFYIFLFRDPKETLNGYWKEKSAIKIDEFINEYIEYCEMYKKYYRKSNVCSVFLKDLCFFHNDYIGLIKYLNNRLKNNLCIFNDFSLKTTNYIFGSKKANENNEIFPYNDDQSLLSFEEKKHIDTKLSNVYEKTINFN